MSKDAAMVLLVHTVPLQHENWQCGVTDKQSLQGALSLDLHISLQLLGCSMSTCMLLLRYYMFCE